MNDDIDTPFCAPDAPSYADLLPGFEGELATQGDYELVNSSPLENCTCTTGHKSVLGSENVELVLEAAFKQPNLIFPINDFEDCFNE